MEVYDNKRQKYWREKVGTADSVCCEDGVLCSMLAEELQCETELMMTIRTRPRCCTYEQHRKHRHIHCTWFIYWFIHWFILIQSFTHLFNCWLSGSFTENWLCWNAGPALFSKVTLFSLPEVFCGPQIYQKCDGGRPGRGSAPDPAGDLTTLPRPFPRLWRVQPLPNPL